MEIRADEVVVGRWLMVNGEPRQVEHVANKGYNVWIYFTDRTHEVYTYTEKLMEVSPQVLDKLRQAFGTQGDA